MAKSYFQGHEAARFDALNGLPLAGFWQRGLGLAIDLMAGMGLWLGLALVWARLTGGSWQGVNRLTLPLLGQLGRGLLAALAICAGMQYATNGRSLGKWLARTRVASLLGERLGLWQCVERVLGYAVAAAEGMGFFQFFWVENCMCVQDRMAETVVLDLRKSALRLEGVDGEDALVVLVERL